MGFSHGISVEIWFYLMMQRLRLLDHTPISLASVMKVAKRHLPARIEQGLKFMKDVDDAEEWLDRILKIDNILRIENVDGIVLRVAVDVSANAPLAESKFQEIQQQSFGRMCCDLGIDRHWVILVDQDELPDEATMIDAIYSAIDEPTRCVMINLRKD